MAIFIVPSGSNFNKTMKLVSILIVSGGSNLNIDNAAGGNTYCVWWFKLQYRQCSWCQYLLCPGGGSNLNIDNAADVNTFCFRWFKLQYR